MVYAYDKNQTKDVIYMKKKEIKEDRKQGLGRVDAFFYIKMYQ